MARKTIAVRELLDMANAYLENSAPKYAAEREGVHSIMGSVLHKTGNYAGFGYLQPYHDPATDRTRTFFHYARGLR